MPGDQGELCIENTIKSVCWDQGLDMEDLCAFCLTKYLLESLPHMSLLIIASTGKHQSCSLLDLTKSVL